MSNKINISARKLAKKPDAALSLVCIILWGIVLIFNAPWRSISFSPVSGLGDLSALSYVALLLLFIALTLPIVRKLLTRKVAWDAFISTIVSSILSFICLAYISKLLFVLSR